MDSYSTELRGEVLAACDAHEETRAIALRFQVSESWVRRIKQQRREGQVAPKTAAPRRPKWHAWAEWLLAKLAARPDLYLRELPAELKHERGEEACLMTIRIACRALEQSRKKDADRQRAGSSGCGRAADPVARHAGTDRSRQSLVDR